MGFTDRERFTRPSRRASENLTLILSVKCLCCYITLATGRFHTKTWIRFILVITYEKIATFIEYTLTSLHNFELHARTSENQEYNPRFRTIDGLSILKIHRIT